MMPAAEASAALAGDSVGAGQRLILCQKLGSITVNTLAGSVANLFLRSPTGSPPAQSFTARTRLVPSRSSSRRRASACCRRITVAAVMVIYLGKQYCMTIGNEPATTARGKCGN